MAQGLKSRPSFHFLPFILFVCHLKSNILPGNSDPRLLYLDFYTINSSIQCGSRRGFRGRKCGTLKDVLSALDLRLQSANLLIQVIVLRGVLMKSTKKRAACFFFPAD